MTWGRLASAGEMTAAEEAFRRCFVNQPPPAELERRLEKTLALYEESDVTDHTRLALATVRRQLGETKSAVSMLEQVVDDGEATALYLDYFRRGGLSEQEMPVVRDLFDYYRTAPDRSSDHALLALAAIYAQDSEWDKAWETLERLRDKYPHGDRVEEDSVFFEVLRKKHGSGEDGQIPAPVASALAYRPRPHLLGLEYQLALTRSCDEFSSMRPAILAAIVRDYRTVLDPERVTGYAQEGLDLLRQKREQGNRQPEDRVLEAVFTEAVEENTPTPEDTGE